MMSPVATTPPLAPAKNTPPRHDSSGSRIQEGVVEGSILNRMREVVMTHYRNSPSAPDRPIDLTHFKDTSKTLTLSLPIDNATQSSVTAMDRDMPPSIPMPLHVDNDDDDEEYVPPGLADFVANVNRELEQQQKEFLNDPSNINGTATSDAEGIFYIKEDRTFETVPTDERYNQYADDGSGKAALKKDILQRCDLLPIHVVLSDDYEEYNGIDHNIINHTSMWSPDIFTSPTPVNPASLMSLSQIKQQVFTSPILTPIPAPPNQRLQTDVAIRLEMTEPEETPTSPLHSLPKFTLSETNRLQKSSPVQVKEMEQLHSTKSKDSSDKNLPLSLENIRLLPNINETALRMYSTDRPLSVGQEVMLEEEAYKRDRHQVNQSPSPYRRTSPLQIAMDRLDIHVNEDEERVDPQPNLPTPSVAQDTPSTLSMASPSKNMAEKTKQFFSQPQSLGHRVSSPIYGYAPTPEYNVGVIDGYSLPPPPTLPHNQPNHPDMQRQSIASNRNSSPAPVGLAANLDEMAQRKPQSPSVGSLFERATKRLLSSSSLDESEAKPIRAKLIDAEQESLPDIQPSQPIVEYTSSLDETKATAPSPQQKFTNRPPQNKPMKTPSPMSMGNSKARSGHKDRQSASMSNRNFNSPPKISVSPSMAVSDTPSPLSMSSPGGHDTRSAFVPSSLSRMSDKKIVSSVVPRFCTPPSPRRIKTASRFTAEAAERLSRPSKSPQPPATTTSRPSAPHYASPLKKSVNAAKFVPSQVSRMSPMISPPVRNRDGILVNSTTKASTKTLSMKSINRLSAPSSTAARRQSLMEYSGTPELQKSTKKTLTSPPLMPSSSNKPNVSSKTAPTSGNDTRTGSSSRRRSVERLSRGKSLKSSGHGSPVIMLTEPLPCADKSIERNLSVDTSNDRGIPRNDLHSSASYKLSTGFEKSFRLSAPKTIQDKPDVASLNTKDRKSPSKSKCSDIIDRLSRPTQARAIAISCTLNPPPPSDEKDAPILVPVQRSPSPFVLNTIERLAKPTVARKAAMHGLANKPHHPPQMTSRPNTVRKEIPVGRPGVRNSQSNSTNQSPKLPSQLDSSSHLLTSTAVSEAKKTMPKKAILRPPTPTRFVTGASDRLTKPTASYRASMLPRATDTNNPQFLSRNTNSANVNNLHQEKRRPTSNVRKESHALTRTLTVPRGPRCANLPPSNKQQRIKECIESPSLAQVLRTFGNGLRDDFSVGSAGSNFSRRSLTIPNGPKLATDIRGGEKYKPPKVNSDVSLAESNTVLQNGLRSPFHPKQRQKHHGPTIPISPKFSVLPSRAPPKSTSDRETEEMEYFKDHQFKAKPPLHSTMQCSYHSSSDKPRHQSNVLPGYMRPTKGKSLNSNETSHSLMTKGRMSSMEIPNKSRSSIAPNKHRQVGLPHSIVTTNLGFAQRVIVRDDGLKDLVEHAARAAKALAIREEARQEKIAQEELERRELASFKAKPIPRTTYEYNPVIPAPTVPLVEPFSPELHTKQRVKERKVFDEYAEQERLARMEHVQAMEDMRQADEDEEISERRRLPVSEGGMIPVAAPVNSVLWNE